MDEGLPCRGGVIGQLSGRTAEPQKNSRAPGRSLARDDDKDGDIRGKSGTGAMNGSGTASTSQVSAPFPDPNQAVYRFFPPARARSRFSLTLSFTTLPIKA